MFSPKLSLAALFFSLASATSAAPLVAGQVYDFSFSNLPFYELASFQNQGGATINFQGDLLDLGEIVRLEFFENSVSDTAFFIHDFTTPTDHFGASVVVPVPWQDLQGVIRVSVLAGSVNVESIATQVISKGSRYFETSYISALPEPSSVYLLATGIAALAPFFLNRKKALQTLREGRSTGNLSV